jgi:asparagine synthase (glutamine-hydrolysing)
MQRWFCGLSSETESSCATLPQPLAQQKMLWLGKSPFWICGDWGKQQVITVGDDLERLAIVGTCLASYKTVAELFQNGLRKNDYSQLMRFPGNYNLIVQDESGIYIYVDIAGLRPVFYTQYNSLIVYSSLAIALQQLTKAEVDPCWLANSLAGLSTINQLQNRSPFCNIHVIPPGHYLHISSQKLQCKRYWNVPQTYRSFSEAAEQLREQLLTAVEGRVRLYGNITSDLSGGFDSTSLALIAAKSLAAQEQKLHTITVKSVAAGESEDIKWATHAANLYPNIVSIMIDSHEIPVEYSGLESIPLTDAIAPSLLDIGQITHEMGIIKSKGSRLHLSGEGGDAVLIASYSYLADLLKRLQIGTFFQHAYGWSRVSQISPVTLISSALKLNLTSYRQWLLQQARKLKTRQPSPQMLLSQPLIDELVAWDSVPEVTSWYTKETVDLVVTDLENWANVAQPFADSPGRHNSVTMIQATAIHSLVQQQVAESFDVNLEFPFLDSLVIEACLCAKPEELTNPFTYKPLLSKALERDLPSSIFTRNTKGDYTVDEIIGFRQNLAVINELFQTSLLANMGIVDLKSLHTFMQQFSMGLAAGSWHFSQTLAVELWLRRVVEASHRFWM